MIRQKQQKMLIWIKKITIALVEYFFLLLFCTKLYTIFMFMTTYVLLFQLQDLVLFLLLPSFLWMTWQGMFI